MSASKEKRQRRMQEEQVRKKRATVYGVIGAIAAILVIALLVWNSGFFQKRTTAATVGGQAYTVADLDYYYYSLANMYAQYGITVDETLRESLRESALNSLQNVILLSQEAKKAGFSLSDEEAAGIDAQIKQIDAICAQYGYTRAAYIKLLYGPYCTESLFREHAALSLLAQEYSTHYQDELTYTDAELEAYYQAHANAMDSYELRVAFVDGAVPTVTDEETGEDVEPTEEETAAAMAAAKEQAEALEAAISEGEDFNAAAARYVSELTAAYYLADPEYNHITGVLGSELPSGYSAWFTGENDRKVGDLGIYEASSGYYVIQVLGRGRSQNTYYNVDVRHLLVLAETTVGEDGTSVPTEEQLAAARTKAESLLDEWKAGAATADTFAQLANLNSDDPGSNTNGGLYKDVVRGQMIPSFENWCFEAGRQQGDTGIVENTNSSTGAVMGYHVMYLDALGQLRWKGNAESSLKSQAYADWYEAQEANYETVANEKGMAMVGSQIN